MVSLGCRVAIHVGGVHRQLLEHRMNGPIGTVGDALDNALCESTIGPFKTEAIDIAGPTWASRREVKWQVASWVHWYNTQRLHSSIGNLPPIEFEHRQRQATTQAPTPEAAQTTTLRKTHGGSPGLLRLRESSQQICVAPTTPPRCDKDASSARLGLLLHGADCSRPGGRPAAHN